MSDTWPQLVAAGHLRRARVRSTCVIAAIARRTGLSVGEVRAIAERLRIADQRRAGGGR